MWSAIENARVVQEYLEKERSLRRIVGPVPPEAVPAGTHLSPFGVIPKPNQPGKWRLIVNLSSPDGHSINDGIEPELSSLRYLRLDDVIKEIARLGRETLGKKSCKKQELESLLGHLQHAATVIRPGRTFVRRLIELMAVFRKVDQYI